MTDQTVQSEEKGCEGKIKPGWEWIFELEPHRSERYYDGDYRITLEQLCKREPLWAANVIRTLKKQNAEILENYEIVRRAVESANDDRKEVIPYE